MNKWLILCKREVVEIERLRYKAHKNVRVEAMSTKSIKSAEEHMKQGGNVLCVNLLSKELMRAEYPEKLYVYLYGHPVQMAEVIKEADERIHFIFPEKKYAEYAEKYYHVQSGFFAQDTRLIKEGIEWQRREVEVLYSGNYLNPEDGKKSMDENTPDIMHEIIYNSIEKYGNPTTSLDEAFALAIRESGCTERDGLIRDLMENYMMPIIEYHMRVYRDAMIRELAERALNVAVYGINWEVLRNKLRVDVRNKVMVVSPFLSAALSPQKLMNTKVLFSTSLPNKESLTEEELLGMNLGCIVLKEKTPFSVELAEETGMVLTYEPSRIKQVCKKVAKMIQSSPSIRKEETGDWAKQMLEYLEEL